MLLNINPIRTPRYLAHSKNLSDPGEAHSSYWNGYLDRRLVSFIEVNAMAPKWTEEKISRWYKEGRGQGEGPTYKPWLTVQDFPGNLGRSHRPWSPKLGRCVHLLSDVEEAAFSIAERSQAVSEAKEQYPFNRALSQAVAKALGIRHPTYPGTNIPCVMTIDLLATVHRPRDTVHIGIDCKTRDQVEDPRVLEKLELNRAILAETGSLHVIFFDSLIPKPLIRNLRWINSGRANPKELLPYPDYLTEVTERMYRHLSSTVFDDRPLRVVCEEFDEASSQQPGTGLRAAKLLIDSYRLDVDLNAPDLPDRPLSDFRIQDSENVNIRKAV